MNLKHTLYILTVISGIVVPFIVSYKKNKEKQIISIEYFLYTYLFFLIAVFFFSKLVVIVLYNNKFNVSDINYKINFFLKGYSFFGGYIGSIISLYFFSSLFKDKKEEIMLLFTSNLLLMGSILKLGCFINGCCYGINHIPIQLVESIIYLIVYILINKSNKNSTFLLKVSLLTFFITRFILYFFRTTNYSIVFITVEIICLFFIFLILKIKTRSE